MGTRALRINSVRRQDFLDISDVTMGGAPRYQVTLRKPDGAELRPAILVERPESADVLAFVVAQDLALEPGLAYGYDDAPYLWMGNRWVRAEQWMESVSLSMHGLLGTGLLQTKASKCFYNLMRAAWRATGRPALALKPFGYVDGVPVEDAVIFLDAAGNPDYRPHDPAHQNLHVLPVQAAAVTDEYLDLDLGNREKSLLLTFLRQALQPDQLTVLRRWFGLHLVTHRLGNQEKLVYMFGSGGNGKGVLSRLLRALVTDDAVVAMKLEDLKASPNREKLAGKLAMLGSEASADTDLEALKGIVSWEPMVVNPKYRDPFELTPTCLVTQASNKTPRFDDDSDAMVRRVIALKMVNQAGDADKVTDLAERICTEEYALLVAFALHGATEVIAAGGLVVPESIAKFSADVVRPLTPADRFVNLLEFGRYEVADDELYAAFELMCRRQRLTVEPKAEFFNRLAKRLEREGRVFLRREKSTGYIPQVHINSRSERVLMVPMLAANKTIDLHLGFRIAAGEFGPAIGQEIPSSRRSLPAFEGDAAGSSLSSLAGVGEASAPAHAGP